MRQAVTLIQPYTRLQVVLVVVCATVVSITHRDNTASSVYNSSTRILKRTSKVHMSANVGLAKSQFH